MNLWDRQPYESAVAYTAFCLYRDLGPSRTVIAAYRKAKNKPAAKQAAGIWNAWVKGHSWETRAGAYDSHLALVQQKAREKAEAEKARTWAMRRETVREKGWTEGEALLAKTEQMLKLPIITTVNDVIEEQRTGPDGKQYPVTIKRTIINPSRWGFADAGRMKEMALEMMRLAAGLSTDHTSADVMSVGVNEGGDALSGEEIDTRLLELLERARSRRAAALADGGGEGGTADADLDGSADVEAECGSPDDRLLQSGS